MRTIARPKRILPNDVRFSPYAFDRLVKGISRSLLPRYFTLTKGMPKPAKKRQLSSSERHITAFARATQISRQTVMSHFSVPRRSA